MTYREKVDKQIEEWNSRHEWINVEVCHYYWNDYNSSIGFKFYESGREIGGISPNTQKFFPSKTATIYNIDIKTMRIISEAVDFLFDNKEKKVLSTEKLKVGDELIEYDIVLDENSLHLVPDYDELQKIAPDGTVMEFHDEELSIYPYKG